MSLPADSVEAVAPSRNEGAEMPKAEGADPEPLTRAEYNAFVAGLALESVDVVAVGGERSSSAEAAQTKFRIRAGFHVEGTQVQYRFDAQGEVLDEDEADCGTVSGSVVVTMVAETPPDPRCVERFGASSASMMAHPFLRELLSTTANRLGFVGVTLPMITRQPEQTED